MPTFDWIVVGNGLAGAALSYELVKQGYTVLLLEQSPAPESATRLSYGGIPYWSGTTPLTTQLCQEGITKHRQLPAELDSDTEFRDLSLVLTLSPEADPVAIAAQYNKFAIQPQLVSATDAAQFEPQLNPSEIAGALVLPHAHVSPQALLQAYNQAFLRLGGTLAIAQVTNLVRIKNQITGVTTAEQAYAAKQIAIATGGYSRALLRQANIKVPLYHTHAELIETQPVDLRMQTLLMPAELQRFAIESQASKANTDDLWDEPGHEITVPILDSGVVQFRDGHLRIGQISRTLTSLDAWVDATASEYQIRQAIKQTLPAFTAIPGQWHRCLVSFSRDGLPLVGPLPGLTGLLLFTGFSSPFALLPPIAQRFAKSWAAQIADPHLDTMTPQRFSEIAIREAAV